MQKKYFNFQPKGMSTTMSPKLQSNEYATYMKNIRLTKTNNGTMAMSFEKCSSEAKITLDGKEVKEIAGCVIGKCVLNDYCILFATAWDTSFSFQPIPSVNENFKDFIYKLKIKGTNITITTLFNGNLNFSPSHPIETLGIYENEEVQKVYFIDGINQARVINVAYDYDKHYSQFSSLKNTMFDFIPTLQLEEEFTINKSVGEGNFPQGTIQYVFSYWNKNGRQSNIFYQSPLYYLSTEKGVSEESKVNCNFNIKVINVDKQFDYLRVYSIIRTSRDAIPTCKKVTDLEISLIKDDDEDSSTKAVNNDNITLTFTDYNTSGETIDNTELLYIGGNIIKPSTFEQKDGTLFLGNYVEENNDLSDEVKLTLLYNIRSEFEHKTTIYAEAVLGFNNDNSVYYEVNNTDYYNYKGGLMHSDISGFKFLEWYGFAIQFQNIYGKYSSPIYIGARLNRYSPKVVNNTVNKPFAYFNITKNLLTKSGVDTSIWKRMRLLIVNPTDSLRTVKCQGILSATVFNYLDRKNNAPYGMASWRMMPIGNHMSTLGLNKDNEGEIQNMSIAPALIGAKTKEDDTKTATITIKYKVNYISTTYSKSIVVKWQGEYTYSEGINIVTKNSYSISNATVFTNNMKQVAINRITDDVAKAIENYTKNLTYPVSYSLAKLDTLKFDTSTVVDGYYVDNKIIYISGSEKKDTTTTNYSSFGIDESVLTFNSPDIEEQANNISDKMGLRIVGVLKPNDKFSSYLIEGTDLYDPTRGMINRNIDEFKSRLVWNDMTSRPDTDDKKPYPTDTENAWYNYLYPVYIWQRESTLADIGQDISGQENFKWGSKLQKKIISNVRNCDTLYFSDLLNTIKSEDINKYYDLLQYSIDDVTTKVVTTNADITYTLGNQFDDYNKGILTMYSDVNKLFPSYNKLSVYAARNANDDLLQSNTDAWQEFKVVNLIQDANSKEVKNVWSREAVKMNYKETMNVLINLGKNSDNIVRSLPMLASNYKGNVNAYNTLTNYNSPFWFYPYNSSGKKCYSENYIIEELVKNKYNLFNGITSSDSIESIHSKLWSNNILNRNISIRDGHKDELYYLAELYTTTDCPYEYIALDEDADADKKVMHYNKDIVANYSFIPTSDTINITDNISLIGKTGDTYYQKWDCLKTFPYSKNNKQQYIDITSFFVESRINLDGRYDAQRGIKYNISLNEESFNSINKNYTQSNNFFSYRVLNQNFIDSFRNQITFTKQKTLGENIDTWTNLTLASTYDLDGLKGKLNALRKINNDIYAFQDTGITRLLYNSRVQINTSDGVPIEIANSAKLEGVQYISDSVGCQNKWSIAITTRGIYFFDGYKKALYLLGSNGLSDLSSSKMKSLFSKFPYTVYKPDDLYVFTNDDDWTYSSTPIRIAFDATVNDVNILSFGNSGLAYNEDLQEFTSFYTDLRELSDIINIQDSSIYTKQVSTISDVASTTFEIPRNLNSTNGGVIEFIANPEFDADKIFDTVEFNTDDTGRQLKHKVNEQVPFNVITVTNDYQSVNSIFTQMTLRKKFRTWRGQLPRMNRNRIRGMWTKIRLSTMNNKSPLTVYDINVAYYD